MTGEDPQDPALGFVNGLLLSIAFWLGVVVGVLFTHWLLPVLVREP